MKSVKGKLVKKLKSIKPVGYLKPDRVLQVFAIDGFIDSCPKAPNPNEQPKLFCKESEQGEIKESCVTVEVQPEIIDVAELMQDLEADSDEEEMDLNEEVEDKENISPAMKANIDAVFEKENVNVPMKFETRNCRQNAPLSEIDVSSFRKPDLNSCTLFDPNLLAAFEQAVKEHIKMSEEERKVRIEQENIEKSREGAEKKARIEEESLENEAPHKTCRIDENGDGDSDPLLGYEEKCPAGGDGSVILYTTTLKGIRKTFEDCNRVRFLMESFGVTFYERDISMHTEYREELWRILDGKIMPPRLFIKGRYIGGAEEVLTLHEQGKLKVLFQGIPVDSSNGPCDGCAGVRFVLCFKCNGSHRILADDGLWSKCLQCNENGLIVCPICC
ncbi:uncharacterized protein At3g28850-like [Durio zibethinus]|uniref:Uncharacterized protein At3g28850-like n=1 Tax=Durio zibethinus TaxID=66656 RepID=A0A6P5YV84_DURZI|nr:uncharacterized protein At3g28850-like [Durio zibethinus]